jgi:hypothetical protein
MREILPAKQINDKRYDRADKQAGGQGKVQSEALALNGYITGQAAEPGNLAGERKNHTHDHQQEPDKDENSTHISHDLSLRNSRVTRDFTGTLTRHDPQNCALGTPAGVPAPSRSLLD